MNNDMIDFNTNAMRLIPLFSRSDELQYTDYGLKCDKVDTIYGKFFVSGYNRFISLFHIWFFRYIYRWKNRF